MEKHEDLSSLINCNKNYFYWRRFLTFYYLETYYPHIRFASFNQNGTIFKFANDKENTDKRNSASTTSNFKNGLDYFVSSAF